MGFILVVVFGETYLQISPSQKVLLVFLLAFNHDEN